MISSLYIFFCSVSLLIFLISFFDWGTNRQKGTLVLSLLSAILSIMMFAFSWNVQTLTGNNDTIIFPAMTSSESYGVALFWFILSVISILLSLVIMLETPKELYRGNQK